MTRSKNPPDVVRVSSNGLTFSDEKMLTRTLAELEVVLEVPHMLGHNDADKGFALQKRLKARLEAEEPSKLVEDAKAYIQQYAEQLARARANLKAREQEHERWVAEQAEKRAAHGADIAARIAAAEEKRRAQIEAWKKENKPNATSQ